MSIPNVMLYIPQTNEISEDNDMPHPSPNGEGHLIDPHACNSYLHDNPSSEPIHTTPSSSDG